VLNEKDCVIESVGLKTFCMVLKLSATADKLWFKANLLNRVRISGLLFVFCFLFFVLWNLEIGIWSLGLCSLFFVPFDKLRTSFGIWNLGLGTWILVLCFLFFVSGLEFRFWGCVIFYRVEEARRAEWAVVATTSLFLHLSIEVFAGFFMLKTW